MVCSDVKHLIKGKVVTSLLNEYRSSTTSIYTQDRVGLFSNKRLGTGSITKQSQNTV